jgi:hypothetical protein
VIAVTLGRRLMSGLGVVGVGLGIGAAVACTPGIASADSTADPFSWLGDLAVPAYAPSSLDLAISFDGYSLVQEGTATAITTSGDYSLAIAYGDESYARASSGIGDIAIADGINTGAYVENGDFSSATAIGDYDAALTGSNSALSNFDSTAVFGDDGEAFAFDGNLLSAVVVGDSTSYAIATGGNDDLASVIDTGSSEDVATAGSGDASVLGNNDIASVIGTGSEAESGVGLSSTASNFDLAAAFGDMLDANATGGNFLVDILPSL